MAEFRIIDFEHTSNDKNTCRIVCEGDTSNITKEFVESHDLVKLKAYEFGYKASWRVEKLQNGSFYLVNPV